MGRPVALLLILISCGGRSELPELAPPPLTANYNPSAHCSAPAYVPGGPTALGKVEVHGDGGYAGQRESWTVSLGDCHDWHFAPARDLSVQGFYLDVDEIGAGCYDDCVAAGQCPARTLGETADASAYLDQSMAESFCEFRGGRLPTVAELSRAANGGEVSIGPPELFEEWTHCLDYQGGAWDDSCAPLLNHLPDRFERHDHALRAISEDVGPFGHYDLFGGLAERTASRLADPDSTTDWCSAADLDDPGTFGDWSRVVFQPALSIASAGYIGGERYWFEQRGLLREDVLMDEAMVPIVGARCAYEAAVGEP